MRKVLVAAAVTLFAVVAVGPLALDVWVHHTSWSGWHIRECGFDSQGLPYAVVRDNTIGGAKHETISVFFQPRPHEKLRGDAPSSRVNLPTVLGTAVGGVTTVIHGTSPQQGPNSRVYCTLGGHGNNDSNDP